MNYSDLTLPLLHGDLKGKVLAKEVENSSNYLRGRKGFFCGILILVSVFTLFGLHDNQRTTSLKQDVVGRTTWAKSFREKTLRGFENVKGFFVHVLPEHLGLVRFSRDHDKSYGDSYHSMIVDGMGQKHTISHQYSSFASRNGIPTTGIPRYPPYRKTVNHDFHMVAGVHHHPISDREGHIMATERHTDLPLGESHRSTSQLAPPPFDMPVEDGNYRYPPFGGGQGDDEQKGLTAPDRHNSGPLYDDSVGLEDHHPNPPFDMPMSDGIPNHPPFDDFPNGGAHGESTAPIGHPHPPVYGDPLGSGEHPPFPPYGMPMTDGVPPQPRPQYYPGRGGNGEYTSPFGHPHGPMYGDSEGTLGHPPYPPLGNPLGYGLPEHRPFEGYPGNGEEGQSTYSWGSYSGPPYGY